MSAGSPSRTSRAIAMGSGSRRRSASRPRSSARRPARSTACSPGMRGRTDHSSRPIRRASLGPAGRRRRRRIGGCSLPARCCAANSGRAAPSANGATPRSSGCCAGARWRACGARSSRSIRPPSGGSCPSGRAWRRSGPPGRRCAGRPHSNGWPRSSTSWPGCRSRRRSSSATCCPRGSPATSRASSTSWGRWARWPGWGGGVSVATTAGSRWSGPGATRSCARPGPRTGSSRRASRATSPSASTSRRAAPRSTASCSPPPAGSPTARCSTPCGISSGPARSPTTPSHRSVRCAGSGPGAARRNGGRGRLTSLGPPEAAGRWSLVAPETAPASPTERLHAQSLALLERHGVVTREAVATEGVEGGFAAVYPVLRAMEDAGRIRRGYFVDGLGAAQFALAGALDRLRAVREPADPPATGAVHLLAAADPANPYGAALAWPRRGETDRRPLQRAAGAYVVLVDGVAALYLERGGATLQTLPAADDPAVAAPAAAFRGLVATVAFAAQVILGRDRWRGRGRLAGSGRSCSTPASWPATAAWCCGRRGPAPECPKATRSSGPRRDSGRTSSVGPSPRHGPAAPAPSRRCPASSGTRSRRSRRSARTS